MVGNVSSAFVAGFQLTTTLAHFMNRFMKQFKETFHLAVHRAKRRWSGYASRWFRLGDLKAPAMRIVSPTLQYAGRSASYARRFPVLAIESEASRPTSRGASSWRQSFEITFSSLRGVLGLVAARDQR